MFSKFNQFNLFMYNIVKWPNILQKSCGANNARFLKYVWPFYNIMHERVKLVKFAKHYQENLEAISKKCFFFFFLPFL